MSVFITKTIRKIRKKQDVKRSFLRDLYFPKRETVEDETIDLETTVNGNRMAPFVSKIEDGRVMKAQGIKTNSIPAPNIAPKYILTPKDVFVREAGENITGGTKAGIRMAKRAGTILAKQEESITNKEEHMVGQFLATGKVQSIGEEQSYEINYEMANQGTLGEGTTWDLTTINPLTDLDNWIINAEKFGEKIEAITMDTIAADAFINNPNVQSLLNNRRIDVMSSDQKNLGPGVAYLGFYKKRSVHLYQYDRTLTDTDGTITSVIPAGTVIGGPIYGEVLYAPIVYFNEGSKGDIHEEIRHSNVKVSQNGKEKYITTESRPVLQPNDMSAYFSWKVVG